MKTRTVIIVPILFSIVIFGLAVPTLTSAGGYESLKGVDSVKILFDFRDGNLKSAPVHLKLIYETYKDKALTGITDKPKFAVVFMDKSVTLLSTSREGVSAEEAKVRDEIAGLLEENSSTDRSVAGFDAPLPVKPYVILVVGVNGVGKTTTIAKLAYNFRKAGRSVLLGAADTFRAAAIDQLKIWSERAGVPMISQKMGADPASVAFDTVTSAVASGTEIVIIDTAGRLHNKTALMNELSKIRRVMEKVVPEAPHEVLLVLDGSTGQNAFEQAKQFTAATSVNAMAITKLDGTAKGGVVIGISDQFRIPVKYIGVGEKMEDLRIFDRYAFVDSLFSESR